MSVNFKDAHARVVNTLRDCTRDLVKYGSVALVGSYGRGEGTVIVGSDNSTQPLNDVEIEIVSEHNVPRNEIDVVAHNIKKALGVDFSDVYHRSPVQLKSARFTMANYDIKYGSTVLWGDPNIMDLMPNWDPAELPMYEGLRLLFNRMAGCLGAFGSDRHLKELGPLGHEQYQTNQIVKLLIACGDVLVIADRVYHHSYRVRHSLFNDIYSKYGLSEKEADLISTAYQYKLSPYKETGKRLRDLWPGVVRQVDPVWSLAIRKYLNMDRLNSISLDNLVTAFLETWMHDTSLIRNLCRRIKWQKRFGLPFVRWPFASGIAVVFLFIAATFLTSDGYGKTYNTYLPYPTKIWELNAAKVYKLWDEMIHGGNIEPW